MAKIMKQFNIINLIYLLVGILIIVNLFQGFMGYSRGARIEAHIQSIISGASPKEMTDRLLPKHVDIINKNNVIIKYTNLWPMQCRGIQYYLDSKGINGVTSNCFETLYKKNWLSVDIDISK